MKRDELIQIFLCDCGVKGCYLINEDWNAASIADFILAREKEQIAKVVEPLRDVIRYNNNCGDNVDRWKMANEFECRVQEALAIADEIIKESK